MITLTNFDSYADKRVSFVLPVKNSAEKLDKILESYRSLVKPEDELIILDGGSKDHTLEVVKKYADLIDIFISEHDFNCTHAANKGILLAHGKYIKSLSDDDTIYPDGMERAIDTMERNPEIDLLLCGGSKEKNGKVSYVYVPPGVNYGKSTEDVFRYSRCGVGHIYRRKSLARVGLFDWGPSGGDVEYLLRFIKSGAVVKFCRINLFHHPYSHYGDAKSLDNFRTKIVKRYCTKIFYWKYLFSRTVTKNLFYGKWLAFQKIICRRVPLFKRFVRGQSSLEYAWDGGFS